MRRHGCPLLVVTWALACAGDGSDVSGARDTGGPAADAAPADGGPVDAAADSACTGHPDGASCALDDPCALQAECRGGVCVATRTLECPVSRCMVSNRCDPSFARCVPTYRRPGDACDDANQCTEDEVCECVDGPRCTLLACGGGTEVPWTEPPCSGPLCFRDVTAEAGIDFVSPRPAPIAHGAGAAVADLNGDGWVDLVLGSESTAPRLYVADGLGGFADATAGSGLEREASDGAVFQGVVAGDYDDDGDLDLYIARYGTNRLLQNDGSGYFADVTAASGTGDPRWSTGGSFGDFDRDGDLDLAVANYVEYEDSFYPHHRAVANALYRNEGDGTFVDVAPELGIGGAGTSSATAGATFVLSFTDFDQDGDTDLLECNDFGQFVSPNQLYVNDGAGGLERRTEELGADVGLFCMTAASGDFDRDGDFDFYHTNIGAHALLAQTESGFVDVAVETGVALERDTCRADLLQTGWGAVFEDFDLDGWPDLFVANGFIQADRSIENAVEQENALFLGSAEGFRSVARPAGVASRASSRGVVGTDYDRDGDVDLLVMNLFGPPELLRNDSTRAGRSLVVELEGRISNRFAPNARVAVTAGDTRWVREYGVQGSLSSARPTELVFGLGNVDGIDELEVRWPSGITSRGLDVAVDSHVTLVEPEVTLARPRLDADGAAVLLRNHAAHPRTVRLEHAFRTASGAISERAETWRVRGGSLELITVPLPAEGPWREVTLTVRDDAGAIDQRRVTTE